VDGTPRFRLAPWIVGIYEAQKKIMDHEFAHLIEEYFQGGGMAGLMQPLPSIRARVTSSTRAWTTSGSPSTRGTPEAERNRRRFSDIGTYYEGLGVLIKEGLLDIRWVALMMAGMVRSMWEKIEPVMEEYRSRTRARMASESEYLYNELMKYLEEHPELKT